MRQVINEDKRLSDKSWKAIGTDIRGFFVTKENRDKAIGFLKALTKKPGISYLVNAIHFENIRRFFFDFVNYLDEIEDFESAAQIVYYSQYWARRIGAKNINQRKHSKEEKEIDLENDEGEVEQKEKVENEEENKEVEQTEAKEETEEEKEEKEEEEEISKPEEEDAQKPETKEEENKENKTPEKDSDSKPELSDKSSQDFVDIESSGSNKTPNLEADIQLEINSNNTIPNLEESNLPDEDAFKRRKSTPFLTLGTLYYDLPIFKKETFWDTAIKIFFEKHLAQYGSSRLATSFKKFLIRNLGICRLCLPDLKKADGVFHLLAETYGIHYDEKTNVFCF